MVWAKLELGLESRLFDHNFKMVAGHLTIGNLVCTTQPPSQIHSCQQTVLHPDGQWTMATDMERTTSFQQDPSWNYDHRVS
jgi:hypothetical protein